MSWPSSEPTTSPSTSRRCAGGPPSRRFATPGPRTRPSSRSTRTTSSRDQTPRPGCTAPGSLDKRMGLRGAPEDLLVPRCACRVGVAVAVLLDQPFGVVAGDEGADGVADLVDGLEDAAVHDLLLQGSEEALDDAIRLGFSDEGIARRHAPEPDLLAEVVGHEVAAVVVAQRDAAGGPGAEVTELLADRHAEGLGGLEAVGGLRHVPTEQLD